MRRAALLILRQEASPDMSRFLADADNDLKYEAARAIYDLPIRSGFEALATMLNEEAGDERLVTRALYANARLGNEASAQRLALFAASPSGSVKYRIQALEILAAWGERQEIDPVVGFYRPIDPRDKARARAALESEVEGIFKDAPTALLAAAVRAVGNLQVSSASPWLYHVFNDPGATGAGRAAVLKALQKLGTRDWGLAVELALKDSAPELRIAALDLLRETPVSELEPNVIRLAQGDDHIKVRQAALQTITNYSGGRVEMFLKEQEVLWGEGKLPPELALDLAVALAHLAKLAFKVNEADLQPLLFGGDKEAGKNIFHNRADVSCLRCHAVEGKGGTVGPELSGIGKKRSREHLTQSILFPNKEIAPGYEQAIVETKEGQSFAGTVKKETENEIELDSSEDGLVKITKSEVTKRTRGLSAMPEGLGEMLTAHELRDLVEYLAGL
jgi:quinoprotein glucose dehydrogenase